VEEGTFRIWIRYDKNEQTVIDRNIMRGEAPFLTLAHEVGHAVTNDALIDTPKPLTEKSSGTIVNELPWMNNIHDYETNKGQDIYALKGHIKVGDKIDTTQAQFVAKDKQTGMFEYAVPMDKQITNRQVGRNPMQALKYKNWQLRQEDQGNAMSQYAKNPSLYKTQYPQEAKIIEQKLGIGKYVDEKSTLPKIEYGTSVV
jgi:hypothetical protein